MIKLFRVDHRLLHGQVAFSWSNSLGANAILVANDEVANSEMRMATIRLAKPAGMKLVIKGIDEAADILNSGKTDPYKLIIIVESIKDAQRLYDQVKGLKSLNLGGIKKMENTTELGIAVHVTHEEKQILKEMITSGLQIEIRQVPDDKREILVKEKL
ncbi:PTS sugar transporter subunit IIB [Amphibacillus sp. Q70]|uniref:PTS sugar transporter subunit IIB n=1 Tax=Amphibacillus sp. Q70 TaxID=3453416 RepID=UPI003F82C837